MSRFWGSIQEVVYFISLSYPQTFIMCIDYARHCARCWTWRRFGMRYRTCAKYRDEYDMVTDLKERNPLFEEADMLMFPWKIMPGELTNMGALYDHPGGDCWTVWP